MTILSYVRNIHGTKNLNNCFIILLYFEDVLEIYVQVLLDEGVLHLLKTVTVVWIHLLLHIVLYITCLMSITIDSIINYKKKFKYVLVHKPLFSFTQIFYGDRGI